MTAKDAVGGRGFAKKRTTILTNSHHVAGVFSKSHCSGDHAHVVLQDGKPKACERYPDVFCDAICRGIRMELQDEAWLDKVYEKIADVNMIGRLTEI